MNILILIESFPPEIKSASHLFYELSEKLVENGHKVTVITGLPRYNVSKLDKKYKRKILLREKMKGINVVRVATFPFPRSVPGARAFEQFLLTFLLFIVGLFLKKKDIVLVYSPPLTLGLCAYLLKVFKKTPFIFNVQDIYPQAVIDLGLLKNRFLIKIAQIMEKFIYKKASSITIYSQGNLKYLISKGINSNKLKIIPNWVDTDLIKPEGKMNQFRNKYKLGNSFVVSFAGTMGFAQDIEIIIESAKLLKDYRDIKFILVGEGVEKEKIQKRAGELKLKNILFLPLQTRQNYPQILAASDICLVTLKEEVKTPAVPGKIMSIMASGRPILASLFLEGDATKLIRKAGAGIVVEPKNSREFARAILKLYKNKKQRESLGKNGRRYCQKNFSLNTCVKKYMKLFEFIKK